MIRIRGVVEYNDGTTVEFKAGTAAFRLWEHFATRQGWQPYDGTHPNDHTMYLAYVALGIADPYEVWVATVFDVDPRKPDGSAIDNDENGATVVPPSLPAPSIAP
jgi:hypothetical protein